MGILARLKTSSVASPQMQKSNETVASMQQAVQNSMPEGDASGTGTEAGGTTPQVDNTVTNKTPGWEDLPEKGGEYQTIGQQLQKAGSVMPQTQKANETVTTMQQAVQNSQKAESAGTGPEGEPSGTGTGAGATKKRNIFQRAFGLGKKKEEEKANEPVKIDWSNGYQSGMMTPGNKLSWVQGMVEYNKWAKENGKEPMDGYEMMAGAGNKDIYKSPEENKKDEKEERRRLAWQRVGNLLENVANLYGTMRGGVNQKIKPIEEYTPRQQQAYNLAHGNNGFFERYNKDRLNRYNLNKIQGDIDNDKDKAEATVDLINARAKNEKDKNPGIITDNENKTKTGELTEETTRLRKAQREKTESDKENNRRVAASTVGKNNATTRNINTRTNKVIEDDDVINEYHKALDGMTPEERKRTENAVNFETTEKTRLLKMREVISDRNIKNNGDSRSSRKYAPKKKKKK